MKATVPPPDAPPQLGDPLSCLPGLGPSRCARLEALGIRDLRQFLSWLPRAYEEAARPASRADLEAVRSEDGAAPTQGSRLRIVAQVVAASLWPPHGRRAVLTLRLRADVAPDLPLRALYFGQPYLKKQFPPGRALCFEGRLSHKRGIVLTSPRVVASSAEAGAPLPLYAEVEGLPPEVLRKAMRAALPALAQWPEPLPQALLAAAGLPPLSEALRALHAPADAADLERGRRRLALQEVLRLERAHRQARVAVPAHTPRTVDPAIWERIRARLPFALNEEQEQVLAALREDLAQGRRLQRLLHGEVGSGKTAVAFSLALALAADGGQIALLAPTEILARQHLERFRAYLQGSRLPVVGLLGDDPAGLRRDALARLRGEQAVIAIGTHALLGPEVRFRALRLVVFDEQHRFGVRQKAALLAKGDAPHVLTMTATPIPRTLAWTHYGGLDALVLRGRAGSGAPIHTEVHVSAQWLDAARALRPMLEAGERAFFVAPRIQGEGGLLERVEELRAGPWRGLEMETVHGRMKGAEIARAVRRFSRRASALLCGTTVVEVGLDVPGVEHMLVVGAERLGLASLHQLRGRLARGTGAGPGRCQIFAEAGALARLRFLEHCSDGFRVAEADLAARGPGSLSGLRQHGVPGFRLFESARDGDLVDLLRRKEWETVLTRTD